VEIYQVSESRNSWCTKS